MIAALTLVCAVTFQGPVQTAGDTTPDRVAPAFATGWLLADTNGDGIADSINGKVVVPAQMDGNWGPRKCDVLEVHPADARVAAGA
jgi:hypothetical protein